MDTGWASALYRNEQHLAPAKRSIGSFQTVRSPQKHNASDVRLATGIRRGSSFKQSITIDRATKGAHLLSSPTPSMAAVGCGSVLITVFIKYYVVLRIVQQRTVQCGYYIWRRTTGCRNICQGPVRVASGANLVLHAKQTEQQRPGAAMAGLSCRNSGKTYPAFIEDGFTGLC